MAELTSTKLNAEQHLLLVCLEQTARHQCTTMN